MADLRFTVDSALLSELGERLVEYVHIALGELIKNAYDADATNVDVVLLGCSKEDEETIIQVQDNGVGMTFEEVQNYWMRIATTNKVKNERSTRYGRPRTGAKGIGRFSCRRLGTKLELKTTARKGEGYETTTVEFNWLEYVPGTDVTEITCPGMHRQQSAGECGTRLVIYGGRAGERMSLS
jgi:HSP90 family molecular chaperone